MALRWTSQAADLLSGRDAGLVIVGSGYQGSFVGAFRLDGQGNIEGTDKVVWTLNHDAPDVASPISPPAGSIFTRPRRGSCPAWTPPPAGLTISARRIGLSNTYASPVAAGGHVYLTARNGTTVVIKDADQLEVEATNSLDETIGATPAPVDHELFIRGDTHLYCIAAPRSSLPFLVGHAASVPVKEMWMPKRLSEGPVSGTGTGNRAMKLKTGTPGSVPHEKAAAASVGSDFDF